MIGSHGDAEVFSFSPTKLLVAGEGGLVTTSDATLARRLRAARNYGDPGTYDPILCGINARMSEFNAALALEGLPRVPAIVRRYNEIAERYDSLLSSLPGIFFQQIDNACVSTRKDYCIAIDPLAAGFTRDWLAARLLELNIETRKYFYPPLHRQKLYRRFKSARAALPITDSVSSQILSLPIYDSLTGHAVETIAAAIHTLSYQARTSR
jgi:dTDP-4-amino-4,6-dideoxygalactose transaminase